MRWVEESRLEEFSDEPELIEVYRKSSKGPVPPSEAYKKAGREVLLSGCRESNFRDYQGAANPQFSMVARFPVGRAPCFTGLPPRFFRRWRRSAPPP